jgi:hypothetical protein
MVEYYIGFPTRRGDAVYGIYTRKISRCVDFGITAEEFSRQQAGSLN